MPARFLLFPGAMEGQQVGLRNLEHDPDTTADLDALRLEIPTIIVHLGQADQWIVMSGHPGRRRIAIGNTVPRGSRQLRRGWPWCTRRGRPHARCGRQTSCASRPSAAALRP